jgi:hypothetical protein
MKTAFQLIEEHGLTLHGDIEHFAELVRADERRAMMQLFTDPENQPTQHGTVTVEYMEKFMAAERQRVVDSLKKQAELAADDYDRRWALEMAAAVAERSNT